MSEAGAVASLERRIRVLIWIFIAGLALSGATAMPLQMELNFVVRVMDANLGFTSEGLRHWLWRVREAVVDTGAKYPFLAYGTDWLAFGHFAIAIAFIGPLRDPVKNVWVIEFGMIACVLVVPFALIAGGFRGIPLGWRLIDCSFGFFGIAPLWWCRKLIRELEAAARG
jgi:hypothetical protein